MLRLKIVLLTAIVTCGQWILLAADADAGLLRRWFSRFRQPATCCSPTVTPTTANFAGLQPGQCSTTCMQTCQRVVVNYVPCTSFRTTYERVPVTTYRPQTSTDPCTGCQVTCMRPCTTFTYRAKRVPCTTYRPVYRTQTFRVPVTSVSNCNTCNTMPTSAAACDTCTTGTPLSGQMVPSGTITTEGGFGTQPVIPGATVTPLPTPADSTPQINPQDSNRSVIEGAGGSSTRMQPPPKNWELTSTKPAAVPGSQRWSSITVVEDRSPVMRKWHYTPAKPAMYVSLDAEESSRTVTKTIRGSFEPVRDESQAEAKREKPETVNSGWKTVKW